MSSITLSPSQKAAEQAFMNFLQDNEKELVISGFSGSGKSWLVNHLYQMFINQAKINTALSTPYFDEVYFTATTNKAASVLAKFMSQDAITIHSLLGLKVRNDYRTGKVKLESTDRTNPIKNSLIFVDEASMIGYELLNIIRQNLGENSKVVFVGDRYQLTPVLESKSPVFETSKKHHIKLKEIQRQVANNPIIKLSSQFRDVIDKSTFTGWPEITADNKHVHVIDRDQFKDLITDRFQDADRDPYAHKILAYTNKQVIAYNNYIRKFHHSSDVFEPGEYVMTNKPLLEANGSSIAYPTDTVVRVTDINPTVNTMYDFNLPGYHVEINESLTVFMPQDPEVTNNLLKSAYKNKEFDKYFYIKDRFADLRSVHALTCHKAQGSTYDEVFVDLNDIGKNTKWYEIARLVYVAISRASHAAYIYGSLPDRRKNK